MKLYPILLSSLFTGLLLSSCGPQKVSDVANARTETIIYNDKETYMIVNDTVDNKFGLAALDGQLILPVEYERIQCLFHPQDRSKDLFIVQNSDKKSGVMDVKGSEVIDLAYDEVVFHNFIAKTDSLEGFIVANLEPFRRGVYDVGGNELLPCEFEEFKYGGKGYFSVICKPDKKRSNRRGVYKDGDEVIPCDYEAVYISGNANGVLVRESAKESDGRHAAKKKYFLFDLADGAKKTSFVESGPAVTDNYVTGERLVNGAYRRGLYDFQGKEIVPADKYSRITESGGTILGSTASNRGYSVMLDRNGKELFNDKSVSLSPIPGTSLFSAYIDFRDGSWVDRYGVVDSKGRWYIPCNYQKITLNNGKLQAYTSRDEFQEFQLK